MQEIPYMILENLTELSESHEHIFLLTLPKVPFYPLSKI